MKEQWLSEIREKMASHTADEPEGLWDAVKTQLPKRKSAVVPLWGRIAAISVAASLVVAVLMLVDFSRPLPVTPLSRSAQTNDLIPEDKTAGNDGMLASSNNNATLRQMREPVPVMQRHLEVRKVGGTEMAVASIDEKVPAAEEMSENKRISVVPADTASGQMNPDEYERFFAAQSPLSSIEAGKPVSNRVTASVYASNMIASSHFNAGYGELVRGGTLPSSLAGNEVWERAPITDVLLANHDQTPVTKKKHNLPVRFGVSVRYRINERWGIESGLFYSYLHSKLTSGSESNRFDMRQSLQYIGLPVSAMFTVWKNANWELYAIGGGAIEKCVAGSSITDFYLNGEYKSSEHSDVMERRLQFSVNASFGAQFNISPRVGIYAEPGVSYYFDNNSGVETIYKDRPFNFSAKLGVRISFE